MRKHNIIFLGDSLTKGNFSANWVRHLGKLVGKTKFKLINLAVNGQTTKNILDTVEGIDFLQPNAIVFLAGTNDIKSSATENIYKENRNEAINNIKSIIQILRSQKNSALFILVSLPPLGEKLESQEMTQIDSFNKQLYQLAIDEKVEYIPFCETIRAQPDAMSGQAYKWGNRIKLKTLILRFVLCLSWNRISAINGYKYLTDSLHLNTKAAKILAKLVENRLIQVLPN